MGEPPHRVVAQTSLNSPAGVRFTPTGGSGTGVLVLAGSSGRIDHQRAQLLAQTGVVAESIQWFGGPGQPDRPTEIPIETFAERVATLRQETDRVVLVGLSFGAEAALVTAALSGGVAAVVGFAPSDVIWAGVRPDGTQTSHWSLAGRALPFVAFDEAWVPDTEPPAFRTLYQASRLADPVATAAAAIPVEAIPEVLLVVGRDDHVWPSLDHADAIRVRRSAFGLDTEVIAVADAGHRAVLPGESPITAGVSMARGGSPEADARLGALAWPALLRVLRAGG